MYILRQDPPETNEVTKRNRFVAHRLLMFVSQMKERGCTRTSEYFWSAVYAVGYAFRGNCRVPERYFQVVAFQNTLFISDSFQNFIDITLGKILSMDRKKRHQQLLSSIPISEFPFERQIYHFKEILHPQQQQTILCNFIADLPLTFQSIALSTKQTTAEKEKYYSD